MGDDDAAIFDSGSAPEQPISQTPEPASPSFQSDHEAMSAAISALSREGGRDQPSARLPTPSISPSDQQQRPDQQPQQPTDGIEDRSTAGLLRALLDERSTRQNLERDLATRREREQAQEREREANAVPFDQRLFEQPQQTVTGAIEERLTPIQSRLETLSTDIDFKLTAIEHGKANFDAAFAAWYQQVGDPNRPNPALYWDVMRSPSPGARIMELHQQNQIRTEVGSDLAAYRAKVEAEVLARYGLAPQNGAEPPAPVSQQPLPPRAANGQFTAAPPARHELRLPTATSRVGRAGSGMPETMLDGSDEAIFDAGRPERRR